MDGFNAKGEELGLCTDPASGRGWWVDAIESV
jgi:hypothetical protein